MMREAHDRAAKCIFSEKNKLRSGDTLDLHGLHPTEAVHIVEKAIKHKQHGMYENHRL